MAIELINSSDDIGGSFVKSNNNFKEQIVSIEIVNGNLKVNKYNGTFYEVPLPIPVEGGQIVSPIGEVLMGTQSGSFNVATISTLDYIYDGQRYNIPTSTIINLSNGDSTYDRIDALVLDVTTNTIGRVDGTPSATPVLPTLVVTQILVGAVYVKAGATAILDRYKLVYTAFVSQQKSIVINNNVANVSYLNDLLDVAISTPSLNEVLTYDGTVWTNSPSNDYVVTNGLTSSFSTFKLGGDLSENTIFPMNGYKVTFQGYTQSTSVNGDGDIESSNSFKVINTDQSMNVNSNGLKFVKNVTGSLSIDMGLTAGSTQSFTQSFQRASGIVALLSDIPPIPDTDPNIPSGQIVFGNTMSTGITSSSAFIFNPNGPNLKFGSSLHIDNTADNTVILAGLYNTASNVSSRSAIIASENSILSNVGTSLIASSIGSCIDNASSTILSSVDSKIINSDNGLLSGSINSICGSVNGILLGGKTNILDSSSDSSIISSANSCVNSMSFCSSVLGGSINIMNCSSNAAMIGGRNNTQANSCQSITVGGDSNSMVKNQASSIIGGSTNILTSFSLASNNSILGGSYNGVCNAFNSSIIGGQTNTIKSGVYRSSILGGQNNNICNGSQQSSIIGGEGNDMFNGVYRSSILGGQNNNISYGIDDAGILSGHDNQILGSSINSTISGGYNNLIASGSADASIISGNNNTVCSASIRSVMIGGQYSLISNSPSSTIGGGFTNTILNSNRSSIVNGFCNTITDGENSNILGGTYNLMSGSHDGSHIIGGNSNEIRGGNQNSAMLGGSSNVITNSGRSVMLGGQINGLTASNGSSFISSCGGTASDIRFSSIIASRGSILTGSTASVIIGGTNQTLTNRDNTVMVPKFVITGSMSTTIDGPEFYGFTGTQSVGTYSFVIKNGLIINIT